MTEHEREVFCGMFKLSIGACMLFGAWEPENEHIMETSFNRIIRAASEILEEEQIDQLIDEAVDSLESTCGVKLTVEKNATQ